ncbi:hypothetical protein ACOMHN_048901 [Nucella lapillus]
MVGDAVVTYNGVSRLKCAARCASKYPCGGFTHSATDRVCMLCGLCGNFSLVDALGYGLYVISKGSEASPDTSSSLCPVNVLAATPPCWTQAFGRLTHVSVGPAGVWGVNGYKQIFARLGTYPTLTSLGFIWAMQADGLLVQLDVGGDTVWGVNHFDQYFYKLKFGGGWQVNVDKPLKWLSASPGGSLWGRDTAGRVVHRPNSTWHPMGMDIQRVDAGLAGVWVLNTTGHLFYRTGTHGDRGTAGTGWQAVQGTFGSVASGRDLVVAVDTAGHVWLRTGLGPDTPTGLAWLRYPGSMQQVDVYQTQEGAALWALDSSGIPFFSLLKD